MGRTGRSAEALALVRQWLEQARADGHTSGTAECLTQISWFCLQLGYAEQGLDCVVAAKSLWAQCGDDEGQAHASAIYAWLLIELGLVDEGFVEANAALELAEKTSNAAILAFALNSKALALMYCRQDQLVRPLFDRALELARSIDDHWAEALYLLDLAFSQFSLAEAARYAGDVEGWRAYCRQTLDSNDAAIAVAARCQDNWSLRIALCNGAEYYGLAGEIERAMSYLERCKGIAGELGPREHIHYLYTLGELLTRAGRLPEALVTCEAAVNLAERNSNMDHKANTYRRLAEVHEALGNFELGLTFYKKFHATYHAQMGEVTRRRAQLLEMQFETHKLQARAAAFEAEAGQDALTGLANRRSFDAQFQRMLGSPFCLGILDLDHFKAVNDDHSHLVGDAVLRQVGEILGGLPGMHAFRLGGEEFALLFPSHDLASARVVADALRAEIEAAPWSAIAPGLVVTASIGLASAGHNPSFGELMAYADRRLYRAKTGGRNRVVASDEADVSRASA